MKNLISMSDFVFKVGNGKPHINYEIDLAKIYDYAIFIKQPLELWMFVPCDEDGNVLEEPIETIGGVEIYIKRYQQAKERCLFKGCVYDREMYAVRKDIRLMIYSVKYDSNDKIEDLVKYNLQLTKTAIKQLGL